MQEKTFQEVIHPCFFTQRPLFVRVKQTSGHHRDLRRGGTFISGELFKNKISYLSNIFVKNFEQDSFIKSSPGFSMTLAFYLRKYMKDELKVFLYVSVTDCFHAFSYVKKCLFFPKFFKLIKYDAGI